MGKNSFYQIPHSTLVLIPDYCVVYYNENREFIQVNYSNHRTDADLFYNLSIDIFDNKDGNKHRDIKVRYIELFVLCHTDGVFKYTTLEFHSVKKFIY